MAILLVPKNVVNLFYNINDNDILLDKNNRKTIGLMIIIDSLVGNIETKSYYYLYYYYYYCCCCH